MPGPAGALLLASALLQPQSAAAETDSSATLSPRPRSSRPITDSIDDHVEQVLKAHEGPCGQADRLGIPCFPASVAMEGPRFSVADAIRRYRPGRPTPGPANEVRERLGGTPSPSLAQVGFDPFCGVKSLARWVSGRTNTYYLYRIRDEHGEQPLLTDRKLDPATFHPRSGVSYEYLGKFTGPCEAEAAWRKALRETSTPRVP